VIWNKLSSLAEVSLYSWFQTFVLYWMLYSFFWMNPRRLNFMFGLFRTLSFCFLPKEVNYFCFQTFRNVGTQTPDTGDSPKRNNITRIKYLIFLMHGSFTSYLLNCCRLRSSIRLSLVQTFLQNTIAIHSLVPYT
jgi:hypothetical protein